MKIISAPTIYVILLVFFFIDLASAHLFSYPYLQLVHSLFSIALFSTGPFTLLCSIFGFLYLEQFVYCGSSYNSLPIIVYASLWVMPLLPFLNKSINLFAYLFFVTSLLIVQSLRYPQWITMSHEIVCTLTQIFVNLIVINLLLKYKN